MSTNAKLSGSTDHKEEEYLNSVIAQVFSLEEVVEIILKFVPDYEPLQDILTLRKVCKLWKKLCFNLMLNCDRFPIKVDLNDTKKLAKFTSTISPNCSIPLSVKVKGEHWLMEQLNFLHEYSRNIVRVKLPTVPSKDVTIPEDKYTILLPKLRTVHVISPPDRLFYPRDSTAEEFIRELTNKSRHLHLKEFVVQIGIENIDFPFTFSEEFCPPDDDHLPANITHLILKDEILDNSYFTDYVSQANLPNLRSLYFKTFDNSPGSGTYDYQILPILHQFASNLVYLKINLFNIDYNPEGKPGLRIPKFPALVTLKLRDVRIGCENDGEPLSDYLPKLKSITIFDCYSHNSLPTLTNLSAWNAQHENLKVFSMWLSPNFTDDSRFNPKQKLSEATIPIERFYNTFSNLETLRVTLSGDAVLAVVILRKVFAQLTHLKELKIVIHYNGSNFGQSLLPEKKRNPCYLLTGVKQNRVPNDRNSWKGLLEGNQNSISSLQRLRKLSLEYKPDYREKKKWRLVPFVFYAFTEIPNLHHIHLEGSFEVKEDNITVWRELSRSITLPEDIILKASDDSDEVYSNDAGDSSEEDDNSAEYIEGDSDVDNEEEDHDNDENTEEDLDSDDNAEEDHDSEENSEDQDSDANVEGGNDMDPNKEEDVGNIEERDHEIV